MLQLSSNNVFRPVVEGACRLNIGGIAIRKTPSPAFKLKLKIQTNFDESGDCQETVQQGGLWGDEVIASKRIPRDEIQIDQLLGHDTFGAVYSGLFKCERVTVKKLLPETQENVERVDIFLAEVKLTATIDHPHIVRFIGVAWNSVSDLCVVEEYMNTGDLRSLLDKYEETRHAMGFDREKTKIAMQVCHALAYMHSLSPPVIHCNFKSRNVLLNEQMEAKVTNFGTSPKQVYKTPAECTTTTLWTAPEVIRGEMHDTNADMFSFGVVMSELDMLSPPYAQARQQIRGMGCRQLRDAEILEKVMKGSLRVNFSESGPMALAELGRACTSGNPLNRPTASEALLAHDMYFFNTLFVHDGSYQSIKSADSTFTPPTAAPQGQSGLWNDNVITAKRISRRKVNTLHLLSRGGFGEVYAGNYNGQHVTVKMLSPEIRGDINHVNKFLAEAKITAIMDHPRIVHFIGVAWDSLSDLCVVMEYMEGGDLRTLLAGYKAMKHPVGIDHKKATIALHVCHALTYLHSLSPPVIHRDLKSRNILLNHTLEAKLTDFGISRERHDSTMTAGVGTSLWMAPEVMLGEKYDDKADMFSFGVVLSELDTHALPYAQSTERNRDSNGRRLPDAIILQQVALGRLHVGFSDASPASIVELGTACVSVDPTLRPTAAEALYKLQVVLTQELA
ncbi:hypothetical protein BBO99_00006464 [Phytophthora kernoviae]|uniref:Protein kinase domain-containing protein n=2 Tax=Phytophthora kernoviae TaxID=325452 RepID=A0A421F700_9STRA|nr:hypothetical protein G195_007139 [Phytophthora kernoviae 00238/432]KAG2520871.1 hypothetical protein JM16_006553 [Phytophthora kernoviae]KAG2523466.1 hypothetical protein JM18_005778 [Phytophthora kernoviae]RLN26710.1 hypothetical protein BBI17_006936 [Phytophthora kernoviae]RLN77796.1 hypothetical protein BBO99_00006464 [Phytophthora kernoviae]